jgi:heterodisulfide reductase subunit B
MSKVSYYPGCSLESTAKDYQKSILGLMPRLGVELMELPDWNCCGATAAHSLDHRACLNLGARNLAIAADMPQPLVVPCALCFSRLKFAQHEVKEGAKELLPELAAKAEAIAQVQVVELNRFLGGDEMIERIKAEQVSGLTGLKPVAYYGCQGQRPPKITGLSDYEHPLDMEKMLSELGADVRDWDFGADCCGASHTVARPDLVYTLVGRLFEHALEAGANCIATGCQMCQANLDMYQKQIAKEMGREVYLPVFYFTELVELALDQKKATGKIKSHFVNPEKLLSETVYPLNQWGQ